jgi:acetyl-CoA carboxylase biotin carboxylase subunit
MEVNARVQVEHPVSELISGVDIITAQLQIASGQPFELTQKHIDLSGYALECRINARTPGHVTLFTPPLGPDVRVDTHLFTGAHVSPYYDPLAAKIIVHADNRELGIRKMLRALRELNIEGISTNLEQQLTILSSKVFQSGVFGTDVYEKMFQEKS